MAGIASIENGKRGGRPKGRKNNVTVEKELELEYLKERVAKAKEKLADSQISLAQGVSYLYKIEKKIDKSGREYEKKPELVTSQYEIESYLAGEFDGEEDLYYYITTTKPENVAIDSLFDRILGKARQTTEHTGKDGGPIQISGVEITVRG